MNAVLVCLACLLGSFQDANPVFSGPQPGEALPAFQMRDVAAAEPDGVLNLVADADGAPLLVVFFHQRTRPAFGLTNALASYAESRKPDGLVAGVCFLTADPTETERWVRQVKSRLPEGIKYGISMEGIEGPGQLGLNREVALTVLLAKDNKVTANFALVEPNLAVDGPKLLQAIADVLGGGEIPDISQLVGGRERAMSLADNSGQMSPINMRPLLGPVIRQGASDADVQAAAAKVEEFVADNPAAQRELGRICSTVVGSGRLEQYGTAKAREYLRKWAQQFAPKERQDK